MTTIERLDWDSAFFGREVGRIFIENVPEFDVAGFTKQAGRFDVVYVFSPEAVQLKSFDLVDRKVVFLCKELSAAPVVLPATSVRPFQKGVDDIDQLISLAIESGGYSRFNIDSNFTRGEYERLYREWIIKSVDKENAFEVLIHCPDDQILGMATITGRPGGMAGIGLLAVKSSARGLGIGTGLIARVKEICRGRGMEALEVVTQLDNTAAVGLYLKSGFDKITTTYIYHYWNDDTV